VMTRAELRRMICGSERLDDQLVLAIRQLARDEGAGELKLAALVDFGVDLVADGEPPLYRELVRREFESFLIRQWLVKGAAP
jgi:hypothetical protein